MVFYFSGTGNSEYAAKCMSDGKIINISDAAKNGVYSYDIDEGESVGFVMPVYYSGIPKTVLDFVGKLSLNGEIQYMYCILTHGGGPGGAGTMLVKALKERGYELNACFDVRMASNYIMFGDLKDDAVIAESIRNAKPVIQDIKEKVDNRECILPKWSTKDGILTASMKCLCDKYMSVKKFHADEGCTGCGMCVKNCPSSLIKMVDGRPVWEEKKCVRCMACLKCPHVQFNKKSNSYRRYSFEKYDK